MDGCMSKRKDAAEEGEKATGKKADIKSNAPIFTERTFIADTYCVRLHRRDIGASKASANGRHRQTND